MNVFTRLSLSKSVAAALFAVGAMSAQSANADTLWNWSYSGTDIAASGTLTTSSVADSLGFYQITGITGSRNGTAITGLYSTGSAIPGNEPYALDNLLQLGSTGQITVHGFGYSMANGSFANPYFADFLSPPAYSEVYTSQSTFTELPIVFSAAPVPEPEIATLMLAGMGAVGFIARRRRRAA